MNRALPLAFALLLTACAGGPNLDLIARAENPLGKPDGQRRPGEGTEDGLASGATLRLADGPVLTVVHGHFRLVENCLIGEGRLRLPDRAGVSDSFNLDFHFRWESWARVRFIGQAQPDGQNAFVLDLARSSAGVQIQTEAQGAVENWSDLTSLQTLLARDEVRFNLDFHHDEAHRQYAHLLFYDGDRLIMDSGRDTVGTPGKGQGASQFLDLENVRLCGLKQGAPKDGG